MPVWYSFFIYPNIHKKMAVLKSVLKLEKLIFRDNRKMAKEVYSYGCS